MQLLVSIPVACFLLLLIRLLNGIFVKYNKTQVTLMKSFFLACCHGSNSRRPHPQLVRGIGATAISGVFFYASLDDVTDPYRLLHGMLGEPIAAPKSCCFIRLTTTPVVPSSFSAPTVENETHEVSLCSGLSQVTIGVALYYLWQVIPVDNYYKKKDSVLPRNFK